MAPWSRSKPAADPIFDRLAHLEAEVQVAQLEQHLSTIAPVEELAYSTAVPGRVGETQPSPFVESAPAVPASRSLIPWRRHVVEATKTAPEPPSRRPVTRAGFVDGIPTGGTTAQNSGYSSTPGTTDRDTDMSDLLNAYLTCPWVATCVDAIARTITAGGLTLAPDITDPEDDAEPTAPPGVDRVQALLDYVNPYEDIRQLMRRVYTDMLIFGDSFTEVTWAMSEPVALWSLDCQTMDIIADEHGNVTGYVQTTITGRTAEFKPHEIIHVRMDAPGAGLYGVSPTSKALVPIKTWLFAAGLVKETMKKGDPPRTHVDWPIALAEPERTKASQQYMSRNLGTRNIGNLFETRGGAVVKEMSPNKIDYWLAVMAESRDQILATMGVPPRKVGISEPGQLGGAGAETGQDRTFLVNTCGPTEELALEKFTFALCYQAFGITEWKIKFKEVDWRDELIVEQIRDLRIRNGSWTLDRYRQDINEPKVEGGDEAVLIERQNLTLWKDLAALSAAGVAAKGAPPTLFGTPAATGGFQPPKGSQDDDPAAPPKPGAKESLEPLSDRWRREFTERRKLALREFARDLHD